MYIWFREIGCNKASAFSVVCLVAMEFYGSVLGSRRGLFFCCKAANCLGCTIRCLRLYACMRAEFLKAGGRYLLLARDAQVSARDGVFDSTKAC